MAEFRSKPGAFVRRTVRRVVLEVSVLVSVTLVLALLDLGATRGWLIAAVVIGGAAYILGGVAMFPRARSLAKEFAVQTLDDRLAIVGNDQQSTAVRYKDLAIDRVISDPHGISEIRLRTAFGQSIVLRDLERLDELYSDLKLRLSEAH